MRLHDRDDRVRGPDSSQEQLQGGVRRPAGRAEPSCWRKMEWAESLTAGNTRMILFIAFNYGGRREIVDAVRDALAAGVDPAEHDRGRHRPPPLLPADARPDLCIRTSGERRLSNFLLWQIGVLGAAISSTSSGPTSARRSSSGRSPTTRVASAVSAARERGRRCLRTASWWPSSGIPIGVAAIMLGGYFLFGLAVVLTVVGAARVLHPPPALPAEPAGGIRGRAGSSLGAFFWGSEGLLVGLAVLVVLTFFWSLFG